MNGIAGDRSRQSGCWRLAAVALLPALFGIWLYWPVWNGGLLADDLLLMGYLQKAGVDGAQLDWQLDWQRVAHDFAGPWAFGSGAFYRPFVTLSFAIDHWLAGGAEYMFHVTSIGLFAACVFSLAVLFGVLFGPWAALLGGLLFAAHPAAHEPICWPCTRADFMVLIAGAWACTAFVRHLRGEPGRHLLWTYVAVVAALLSKEVAVLLAAWLLLLDLAVRGRDVPLLLRLRLHARFVPVWVLYFVWRWLVLGSALPGLGPLPGAEPLPTWIAMQASKLQACVVPAGSRLPASTPFFMGLLVAWVAVGGIAWAANRRWLAVGLVWLFVSFLPTQWHPVSPNLGAGRIVLAAMAGLALTVAAVLGGTAGPRWFRWIGALLLLPAVIALAAGARAIQAAYRQAWQQMAALRPQVDAAGGRATAAAPLVMLAGMPLDAELPFLPPTMAFALATPPLASRDHAFVSLGLSFGRGVGPEMLEMEVGPWRALWNQGATLCYWTTQSTEGRLVLVPSREASPEISPEISFVAMPEGFAVRGGSASPWPIGGIEVLADSAFVGGELVWRTGAGQGGRQPIGPARATAAGWSAVVDMAEDWQFLALGTLVGIAGFRAELASPARAHSLRVLAPAMPARLAAKLRGASVALTELARRLPLASVPPDADPFSPTAVLMNRVCMFRVRLAGGAVQLPAPVPSLLRELDRFVCSDRVYYYLECRVNGRPWRSEVDWFLRVPPR